MTRRPMLLRAASLALSLGVVFAAAAQDAPRKPPRRLPPTAIDNNRVPAGVDTGSPLTTDALPLGTPIQPATALERNQIRDRAAAARAAARRGGATASAPAATSSGPMANRVPPGPAALGAQTDPRNATAAATAAERATSPGLRLQASSPR
ncbi:MAG: hypothetical protein ABI281_09190 [Caldimonas sp.]